MDARKEFLFSHRPKLVARRFQLRINDPGVPPGVEFVIANIGDAKAIVEGAKLQVTIRPASAMHELETNSFPPYGDGPEMLRGQEYEPAHREAQFLDLEGVKDPAAVLRGLLDGTAGLACFGFVRYKDALGRFQETRFFRRYSGDRFLTAKDDPDYKEN